jgi:TolB-like protein/DNA-binding winged helix-turn-helix (wHTH) protein/Tfp pilus assembly protein PilF
MQPRVSEEEVIRFRDFELALKSGELRKNGEVVRLQPQPFKVLVFLASHAGQTITRQELQQAVWEGETFVDFEHGLNFCIKQIRSALSDDAQSPRFIETLPRRGYRFIAAVEKFNGSAQPQVAPEIEPATTGKPFARWFIFAGIIVAIVLAAFVWRSFNRAAPRSKVMIAVLPFENLGSADQDYFADGMTEEMIARLGRVEPQRLGVIARTSAMTYKGVKKDIARIGSELGVDFVLEGSVRREEERVRITAQLIAVSDQTHLWSQTFDRAAGDALSAQSDVADQIARALAIELLKDKTGEASTNAEAVDAYLRGRYLWNRGDRESVAKSVEYFKQAIEKDPRYAAAFAGLADSYRLLGMYYAMLPAESYPKAKEAAQRAVEIDPSNAEAYVSLGTIAFRYEWKWEEAEQNFLRAIEINPSLGLAHHDYSWFLVSMGRLNEGIEQMKLAQRLDPLSPLANSDVGWVYLMARRYDEAIEQIKRTLEIEPRFGSALACLERAYTLKGEHREALEVLSRESGQTSADIKSGDPQREVKAIYRARLDRRLEAMKKTRRSSYDLAVLYAAVDERDQAFEWIERAFEERDPMLVSIRSDPAVDVLRADPRFDRLLKRMGFAQ